MKEAEITTERPPKRVLFLANHFTTLFHYRRELIKKLIENGDEVYLSIPEDESNIYFSDMGCHIVPIEMERRGTNPAKDIKLIKSYKKLLSQVKPDIIFSYTIKPNIYGCLASNGKYRQVCNITGTGATFIKDNALAKICRALYKASISKCYKVFFQNTGDRDYFVKHKMVRDNYAMLPGSGCDLAEHPYSEIPFDEETKFIFVGRVMEVKGIDEYLACAKAIKIKYPNTKFYVAGWIEEEKYGDLIKKYSDDGYIEYLGYRKDVANLMSKCCCTILPSHGGEGIPNVMLESSAEGRICIASNINGSRDVVEEGKTGFLFNPGDAEDLASQVEKVLAMSHEERVAMGKAGHDKIAKEFDRNIVINAYLDEVKNA